MPILRIKQYRWHRRASDRQIIGWLLVFAAILCALLVLIGCNKPTHYQAVLITDRPWPIGEARSCSFDGQWKELHCFPPENISVTPKYKYMVTADFDEPVDFDRDQWAYEIVCRLDSFKHATCRHSRP